MEVPVTVATAAALQMTVGRSASASLAARRRTSSTWLACRHLDNLGGADIAHRVVGLGLNAVSLPHDGANLPDASARHRGVGARGLPVHLEVDSRHAHAARFRGGHRHRAPPRDRTVVQRLRDGNNRGVVSPSAVEFCTTTLAGGLDPFSKPTRITSP
jgi:hypothetical protein